MLVNATEMLIKARDGHYGVPQFNINNLEWTKSVLTACEEMKSPVILGVSEGAGKYMTGFKTVAAMVSAMVDSMGITVPVALHLDHGTYEGCKACIEAGFSSIMFDGSHYSIEENVEKTKELVALAHAKGLSIEAEVGSIGGVEDGVVGAGEIADPEECAKITALGIDFLAAGIGNIHGVYPANWKGLDFEALDRIHKATNNIPLVLHGGTGIPDEMIAKAISLGVSKININNLEWTKAVLTACEEMKSPVILGVSEGAGKYMTGFKTVAAMVSSMVETMGITVPVALHLDHGTYEGCKACVEAGFSSIMFDGSHYSIEENVEKTKELVALAHSKGLSIEAEVGSIGGVEDGVVGAGEIADPAECAKITDLGIDFLAAGIGNIHGVYPANWKGLDFEALDRIHKATNNIPLVLHGGTGIPDEMIQKAISLGVSKININTECQLVFAEATRKYIEAGKDQQGKGFEIGRAHV